MRISLALLAIGVVAAAASNSREQRGIFDEAERLLSGLNRGLDRFQVQARNEFGRLRPLAERMESQMRPAVERMGQNMAGALNTMVERMGGMTVGNPFGDGGGVSERVEPSSGPGLDHFLEQWAGEPLDPFRIFGMSRKKWWEGPNVCVERKVVDDGDEDEEEEQRQVSSSSGFMMDMTMTSCRDGDSFHECTTHYNSNGRKKTVVVMHQCCYGHARSSSEGSVGCEEVEVRSMKETVQDLEGDEFLQLMASAGLESMLEEANVTVLVPSNDAVEDFRHDLEQLNSLDGGEMKGVQYNVDDGLISSRRKRSVTIVEAPRLEDLLKNHVVDTAMLTSDFHDEQLIESRSAGSKLRITVYNTYPEKVVMANCARLTSRDHHVEGGSVAHAVDKMVVPAVRSAADVIANDAQFTTFSSVLEDTGLIGKLGEEGQMTVFAPTNAAFDKLDKLTKDKVLSGSGCAKDIMENHILPNVICSGVVETKARTVNSQGKYMILDRDEDDNLTIDDVRIVMRDVMATNGVIHVIEDILIPATARSVDDALKTSGADTLRDLMAEAGLTDDPAFANATVFAPSERALEAMPEEFMKELKEDKSKLREFLLYHVASPKTCKCDFEDGKLLDSGVTGKKLRLNVYSSAPVNLFDLRPKQFATVQCAKITRLDDEVCGGMIHTVDKVLLPPAGDLAEVMGNSGEFSKFLELVDVAEMREELLQEEGPMTVMAPTDDAFEHLDEAVYEEAKEDKEAAMRIVKRHVIGGQVCCSGVPRQVPFFDASGHRTLEGDVASLRRSSAGHIYADRAEVTRCDMVADNGVVHAIDRVMVPDALKPEEEVVRERSSSSNRRRLPFNIFKLF